MELGEVVLDEGGLNGVIKGKGRVTRFTRGHLKSIWRSGIVRL